jgi:dTDP-4-dehydrorhamnose 3,5-epimerase
MQRIETELPGVYIIEPKVYYDNRGYFYESFSEKKFKDLGFNINFVQENQSKSKLGVLRGLHFQLPPYAQTKLVRVVKGYVLDIAVDIRKGSPTFGKYVAVMLSDTNHKQLFIPRGFAHGFITLSEEAILQYKCDNPYAPECEGSIVWNDPDINIDWPLIERDIILSEKDKIAPMLKDAKQLFDYCDFQYETLSNNENNIAKN